MCLRKGVSGIQKVHREQPTEQTAHANTKGDQFEIQQRITEMHKRLGEAVQTQCDHEKRG